MPATTRFSSRRGRPRSERPSVDLGTPELILKRAYGETAETLDLCLERNIITDSQHRCGMHFRWLYTLRYGAPDISARDFTHIPAPLISSDDPEWRHTREAEFGHAADHLRQTGHYHVIMRYCVYNERPAFVRRDRLHAAFNQPELEEKLHHNRLIFQQGLDHLERLWKK